ncbi:MAG: NAD(P)H-dependent oxidoreductase subunit E [Minwuiales bacterium]|nr:NAD(P)H-dependent oxidoreductase subunit E [Minwuiales bacterium]
MSTASEQASVPKPPGKHRRKGRSHRRGRQVEPKALEEVRALLGDRPRRADLLVEHLHLLQDAYGHLSAAHLAALAAEMRLAMAEVYEVATFYHNFDVVKEGAPAPPEVTVRVCDSLTCAMFGAEALKHELATHLGDGVRVKYAACMGRCEQAPVARIGNRYVGGATPETVEAAVDAGSEPAPLPDYTDLDAYRGDGGYRLLGACLNGEKTPDAIIEALDQSGLRGLGGAGFPTGRKWRFVRQEPGPRLMAVNADESEPGTFKDRYYLFRDPHRFLEGMLLGAWAVEADSVYIYLRDEYPECRAILETEIDKAKAAGLVRPEIHLRRGAGAYICGEESAMLESLEGKRGLPRHKPPFPSQVGLFGRPTLINNVETLFWVRDLIERGHDWFAAEGRRGRVGLRSFSVSGRVKKPGVYFAPAGISVRELIDEYCGGMADGHSFKGYLPGGASGGILPASLGDLPLDFGTLEEYGCLIGSAAIIVLSDADSAAAAALNLMRFFESESCGQCTPCRAGTEKAVKLMDGPGPWDTALLSELSSCMMDASICGLGQAAPNGLLSVLKYFPSDLADPEAK